ncbi:hypothetical protein HF1_13630 [Mycoplasma haemofelis str. Langford 1]|uniref:Uncharacterized protein n=1 Tax=Mycoplasma haemofelis (strain Langford 1) TaxID=941640 RepID=E8ZJQ0_MYCHL|nr:hypothetical protein [Mycoplasma haemofelis]CBY93371.1 hypothetical protein HF1_13630 [Mycoplasma haemofelis str. Langford 1]
MGFSKIAIPTLAAGSSAASVGGYFYATSGRQTKTTVLDKVQASLKDHQRILLSKGDSAWEKFKEVYSHQPSKQISNVSSEQINSWCESTLKGEFVQLKYDQAMMWCVIYDRSIKDHLGDSLLPESGDGVEEKWKSAWEKFNTDNGGAGDLQIPDDQLENVDPKGKDKGGPALQKWCTSKYGVKMYELNADGLSKKVGRWCVEAKN